MPGKGNLALGGMWLAKDTGQENRVHTQPACLHSAAPWGLIAGGQEGPLTVGLRLALPGRL